MTPRRMCARCLSPTPATESVGFGFGGAEFVLDLCTQHHTDTMGQLHLLMRLAREVEPEARPRKTISQREDWRGTPIAGKVVVPAPARPVEPPPDVNTLRRGADRPDYAGAVEAAALAKELGIRADGAARSNVAGVPVVMVPRNAADWYFTDHAKQRMRERDVSLWEVLWACEVPERDWPSADPKYPTNRVYVRKGIKVVVEPQRRVVVTVARQDGTEE